MKKKILALTLVALLALPLAAGAAEIAPSFPALFTSSGLTLDYAAPISRAQFSMLTFEAFRSINGGVFPQMEAKNIFTDVGENPEDMFVVMLYGLRIVNGVGGDAFAPRRTITREEACTMLTRAALRQNPDIMVEIEKADVSAIPGADEVSTWAKESVAYMYEKGVLTLCGDSLSPKAPLTCEEAMVMCTAYIGA